MRATPGLPLTGSSHPPKRLAMLTSSKTRHGSPGNFKQKQSRKELFVQFRSALHALYWLKDSRYIAEKMGSPFSPFFCDVQIRPDGTPSLDSYEDAVHARCDLMKLIRRMPKAERYILATYCFKASLVRGAAADLVAAYRGCTARHGYALISSAIADYERLLVENDYVRDMSGIGDAPR